MSGSYEVSRYETKERHAGRWATYSVSDGAISNYGSARISAAFGRLVGSNTNILRRSFTKPAASSSETQCGLKRVVRCHAHSSSAFAGVGSGRYRQMRQLLGTSHHEGENGCALCAFMNRGCSRMKAFQPSESTHDSGT